MIREEAVQLVQEFRQLFEGMVFSGVVCGSIRRNKAEVGDAEVVICTKSELERGQIHYRLNGLILGGHIEKARYGDEQSYRWGQLYKGVVYKGLRIEMFFCDPCNRGYIEWLRTGPAEGNLWMVTAKPFHPVKIEKGYVWWNGYRLKVENEAVWFRLCRMEYLSPSVRSAEEYARAWRLPSLSEHELWGLVADDFPVQGELL